MLLINIMGVSWALGVGLCLAGTCVHPPQVLLDRSGSFVEGTPEGGIQETWRVGAAAAAPQVLPFTTCCIDFNFICALGRNCVLPTVPVVQTSVLVLVQDLVPRSIACTHS